MLVTVPDRATTVEVSFVEPLKVRIAFWVSAIAWLLLLVVGIKAARDAIADSRVRIAN